MYLLSKQLTFDYRFPCRADNASIKHRVTGTTIARIASVKFQGPLDFIPLKGRLLRGSIIFVNSFTWDSKNG